MDYTHRALEDVRRELYAVGLANIWHATDVVIDYSPLSLLHRDVGFAFGWFQGGRLTIPRWNTSLSNACKRVFDNGSTTSLRDVIRHEFGHAVRFFLGDMFSTRRPWTGARGSTDYADSLDSPEGRAEEDFAECFMLFLKLRGRFVAGDTWRVTPAKWEAVRSTIARAGRLEVEVTVDCPHCGRGVKAPPLVDQICPWARCRKEFIIP